MKRQNPVSFSPLPKDFWAKTSLAGEPGISVLDHCINVGCVAEVILSRLPRAVARLLPAGSVTLAALHDLGKISAGFQSKCRAWLERVGILETAIRERWMEPQQAETDHSKVTQYFLQQILKAAGTHGWGIAAGVHHGRLFGRRIHQINVISGAEKWELAAREALVDELVAIFGPLPTVPPRKDDVDLWCLAGLISVADWIGSNAAFFPQSHGLSPEESRRAAARALDHLRWGSGDLLDADFSTLFAGYRPQPLQATLHDACQKPGLFIVEGPMGCGKTEAALWAAHRLIAAEENGGIYFALPTQVTSNRIHRRIAPFLEAALKDRATLRLAHGSSWLEENQTLVLHPATQQELESREHVAEGRSWFASSKHALFARYGVGTVDQALQGVVAVKHFFVRRFGLAGKVVILDEVHSYDVYTGTLITHLIRELLALNCSVIVLSATLTRERRKELVEAAGGESQGVASDSYPLVTISRVGELVREIPVAKGNSRTVTIQCAAFSQETILQQCIRRAEQGQHVLYLRNTVPEAQAAFRMVAGGIREERVEVGLLHSRFPLFRRQQLEGRWLERLGKQRSTDGRGSILIATQVVEQSVDIDLDFIVTDLAPTDMLLQRMGRLWRHARPDRRASEPEFWINSPSLETAAAARALKSAFGKTGRVYSPYVLFRTAEIFAGRQWVTLPEDIRELLEATYAERSEEAECAHQLKQELQKTREEDEAMAASATKVFGLPAQQDAEGLLTRRSGAPTKDIVLLRGCELLGRDQWRITPLKGEPFDVSGYAWSLKAARILNLQVVRAPLYSIPSQPCPPWLGLHLHERAAWAVVKEDGACEFPEAEGDSALGYSELVGLHVCSNQPQPNYHAEDDDEFDY